MESLTGFSVEKEEVWSRASSVFGGPLMVTLFELTALRYGRELLE